MFVFTVSFNLQKKVEHFSAENLMSKFCVGKSALKRERCVRTCIAYVLLAKSLSVSFLCALIASSLIFYFWDVACQYFRILIDKTGAGNIFRTLCRGLTNYIIVWNQVTQRPSTQNLENISHTYVLINSYISRTYKRYRFPNLHKRGRGVVLFITWKS